MSDSEESDSKRCKLTLQNHMETLNEYLLDNLFCFVDRTEQEATLLFVCRKIRNFFLPKLPLTKCANNIQFADRLTWLAWQIRCCSDPERLGDLFRLCMEKELDSCVEYLLRGNFDIRFNSKIKTRTGTPICTCDLLGLNILRDLLNSSQRALIFSRSYICDFFKRVSLHDPIVCGHTLYLLAIRNNDIEVLKLLEDAKFKGHRGTEISTSFYPNRSIRGGIRWACQRGHIEALQFLLLQWANRGDGGRRPTDEVDQYKAGLSRGLCWASRRGDQKCVEILLGCPETDLSFYNNYALKRALIGDHKGIFDLLAQDKRVLMSTVIRIIHEFKTQYCL